jgi:hypothetical protein
MLKRLLAAFDCAVHSNDGDDEALSRSYVINNEAVYAEVISVTFEYFPRVMNDYLGFQPEISKK